MVATFVAAAMVLLPCGFLPSHPVPRAAARYPRPPRSVVSTCADSKKTVVIELSEDEALVLNQWLSRFNSQELEDGHVRIQFEDQAEQRVLWNIECDLERQIGCIFSADYSDQLVAARAAVRDPAE